MAPPVRIAALGGLGEIGMNCLALECDGRIAVVDCGLLFPGEPYGVEAVAPDLSWLRERRDRVCAVLLTHGHEDHIGGLPALLREIAAPPPVLYYAGDLAALADTVKGISKQEEAELEAERGERSDKRK
mgnify:CR=1 FL=1